MQGRCRRSARAARFAQAPAILVCAGTVLWFAFSPPTGWGPNILHANAFLTGQLTLVMIWAALGASPCYVRWPCAGTSLWLTAQSLHLTDAQPLHLTDELHGFWRLSLNGGILHQALLTFTVLCVLRELGMRVVPLAASIGQVPSVRQFSLRRIFAWMAGAAVLSWAWSRLLALVFLADWIVECLPEVAVELVAVWATLRCKPLPMRLAWLIAPALLFQTIANYVHYMITVGPVFTWWEVLWLVCIRDTYFLTPIVAALLTVRAAGYRLTWAKALPTI